METIAEPISAFLRFWSTVLADGGGNTNFGNVLNSSNLSPCVEQSLSWMADLTVVNFTKISQTAFGILQ